MPLTDRHTPLLIDEEAFRAEPPKVLTSKIKTESEVLDLKASGMQTVETARRLPKQHGSSPATLAGNLESTPRGARPDSQISIFLRDSSPDVLSLTRRSTRLLAVKTPSSKKPTRRVIGKSLVKARSSHESRSADLKKSIPNRFLPAPELRVKTPKGSVAALLPPLPGRQATQPKTSSNKDVIFHFYLADKNHGAIPQPLECCTTTDSFFDEALAAWSTLSEEQYQPRIIAVKVIIEGISRPIAILWKNEEGFERMINTVLEQAAGKHMKLNVEVYCLKRG